MKRAAPNLERLTPAWQAFESRSPVKLGTVSSRRHYSAMTRFMRTLLDEIGDDETHPLCGLLDVVSALVEDYDARSIAAPHGSPLEALQLLMAEHQLRQVDLADVFGAQSNVSEVLSGKRSINARQARALAERFGVSAAVFI